MNQLLSVQIQRFKAVSDASIELGALNVLVGSNNAGKSSIIQGLHFGIGLLQTILLTGNWTDGDIISTSINPTQLIYTPSENVNSLSLGGTLLEKKEAGISLAFTLASGERPCVTVRKGRNRNILVGVESAIAAKRLASLQEPFSVFSPGLAGIAKTETKLSDGVLLRMIARGDANLVLRNILLRLWDTAEWGSFLGDLHYIFPDLKFRVNFKEETDEFISVEILVAKEWIPLELVGTGVLQATQILSYIHRFSPSIVVLDEPDSHLHPNNQRLMCSLLHKVAEERDTQIILTTHSRHIVDAIGSTTKFLWVRKGKVDVADLDDEIGVLLDIGALDVKERVSEAGTRAIVLTEDENTRPLSALLAAVGLTDRDVVILPYNGITTIKQLRPLVQTIRSSNPSAKLLLHRDRDYLLDVEANEWMAAVRGLKVEPFLTEGVDIESHFLDVDHLSQINTAGSKEDFARLIEVSMEATKDDSVGHIVNGRIQISRNKGTHASINHGQLAVEAPKLYEQNPFKMCHGKTVLKRLRKEFQTEFHSTLQDTLPTEHIISPTLAAFARKVVSPSPC